MCHKCQWIEVDGIQAHVNGDVKDPETLDALKTLIYRTVKGMQE